MDTTYRVGQTITFGRKRRTGTVVAVREHARGVTLTVRYNGAVVTIERGA